MSTSLNGWPGIYKLDVNGNKVSDYSSPQLATGTVPGTHKRVTLQRDVLPLFLAYLSEWHHTVHSIDYAGALGPDGYEYRDARSGAGLSCHASGTAVDVTYDWLAADHQRHMNASQTAAVHRLLDKYVTSTGKRIFGWGGDWTVGTYCDEMHTEIIQSWSPGARNANGTLADVRDVIRRLGIKPDGTFTVPPGPIAPPPPVAPTVRVPPFPGTLKLGSTGDAVKALQLGLIAGGNTMVKADGQYGPITKERVRMTQLRHPWWLEWGGNCGPKTYAAVAKPL